MKLCLVWTCIITHGNWLILHQPHWPHYYDSCWVDSHFDHWLSDYNDVLITAPNDRVDRATASTALAAFIPCRWYYSQFPAVPECTVRWLGTDCSSAWVAAPTSRMFRHWDDPDAAGIWTGCWHHWMHWAETASVQCTSCAARRCRQCIVSC